MSENEIYRFRFTIPGPEWWFHAAAIGILANMTNDESYNITPAEQGATMTIVGIVGEEQDDDLPVAVSVIDTIGSFTLTPSERGNTVITGYGVASMRKRWTAVLEQVKDLATDARGIRQTVIGSRPEAAIEYYYRSRAQGSRITLREVAKATNFSEAYLRKIKVSYDKAGKWGSKHKVR